MMHPVRKIEVEPLSEQRWSRIEASIFEALDRERADQERGLVTAPRIMKSEPPPRPSRSWQGRPGVALVMAGALAAAIGGLVMRTALRDGPGYAGGGSPAAPIPSGLASSRIVTTSSDSHLALGDSDVDVAPDSAVLVTGDDERGMLLVLDRGKVDCEVAPRKGRPPFVVQAGDVRVRVVGTHFSVARDAQGNGAHVMVAAGVVEVTTHGQTASVHAGEIWPPKEPEALPTHDPPTHDSVGTLGVAPSSPESPSTQVASAQGASPGGAAPRRAAPRPVKSVAHGPRTLSTAGNAGSHAAEAPAAPAPLPIPVNAPPAPATRSEGAANPLPAPPRGVVPPPPAAAPVAPVTAAPVTAAPVTAAPPVAAPAPAPAAAPASAQDLYEAAARMEHQSPEDALLLYRRVAAGGGAWAANALFAAGRLQSDRGRRADAQRLLNDYLTRFPSGPNAADAKELLEKMR